MRFSLVYKKVNYLRRRLRDALVESVAARWHVAEKRASPLRRVSVTEKQVIVIICDFSIFA